MTGQGERGRMQEATPPAGSRPLPPRPPRRWPVRPPWVYKLRRRVAVGLLLLLIVLFIRFCVPSEHDREMKAWREQAQQPQVVQELDGVDQDIPPSRPVEMRIPAIGLTASFEPGDCRFRNGAIDPESLTEACAFTTEGKPYSLPGTNADDISVIAGHAAAGRAAVFDSLYNASADRHTINPGDTLYIKTENSGNEWLKYQATDFHSPEKEGLSQSVEIWGDVPMPGRLLTITCVQPANPFRQSVRNAVIGWQLQGVAGPDQLV